jgi:hypothetical protein
MLRVLVAIILAGALLGACGYRPVGSRLVVDLDERIQFVPFVVENRTADLSLTHSVTRAARTELGRRGVLAPDERDDDAFALRIVLRSVSEVPIAYSPVGGRLRNQGRLILSYTVHTPGRDPVMHIRREQIVYQYDHHPSPQIAQQHRLEAIETAVREWIPRFLIGSGAAIVEQRRGREVPDHDVDDWDDEADDAEDEGWLE